MPDITVIDLSDVELHDESTTGQTFEQLQKEFKLGDIVSTDAGDGIIAAFVEEPFEWPVGDPDKIETKPDEDAETREIEASADNPVYIVALQDGGSVAVSADEISEDGSLEGDGAEITEWPPEGAATAEAAPIYQYCDDPANIEELQAAKKKYIHENNAEELAAYVEDNNTSLATLEELSADELVNIRGVDDPETGFSDMPNGWTRKSVLQAWASLGGMWRTCFPRMVRVRGPNFAKRWCSALKDEVLGTEEWRGKF